MEKTVSGSQNPALEPLDVLVGDWDMEVSHASFLPNASETLTGHITVELREGGAFLAISMGSKPPSTPEAIWLISRDTSTPHYTVLYYDARKVSRVYGMSFAEGVWKMWRSSPDFSQRFEGKVSGAGNTITAYWEKSNDGLTWEHDFDVTYAKAR